MTAARGNGSVPDGCVAAHVALERSDHALQEVAELKKTLLKHYELLAELRRGLSGMRTEMRLGFEQFGVLLKHTQEGVEELEDTKVRDLRAALKAAQSGETWWRRRVIGVVLMAVATIVISLIIAALKGRHG